MFHIIKQHGWTYVSVVHVTGSYGENGFKQLRDLFDQNGICLAVVRKISRKMTVDEAEDVAEDLVAHSNARVVIVISNRDNAQMIIAATGLLSPSGSFLWMASDAWANSPTYMTDLGDLLLDAFLVSPMVADIDEFEERFMNLRPNDTADPWFPEYWERLFNCSLQDGTCNTTLTAHEANASDNRPTTFSGHIIDTVFMLANATARVLAATPECEGVTGRGARDCVTGPRLLSELKATRQNGYTGWLELDANGDRLGRYVIKQVVPDPVHVYDTVVVAEFDSLTRKMTLTNNVTWFYHAPLPGQDHPESKCSHPCAAHEARVVQEVTCCWLCNPCRVNDRLAFNGTRCEACPPFTWPDPDTDESTCLAIPPDTPRLDSVMGAVQTALAFLCLLVCLLVFIFFHRHRSCRVIKASSRELSFLMLLAIAMGYVVMVTMVAPPTDLTCRLNFLLFCLSFTLLYGPLLVRALRIFRIFEASKRSARRPRFIESGHQIVFSFAFIAVQVVMCVVMMLEHPEWHRLSQSSPQEYYVELSCEFPQAALASFLVYNVLLVAVCTLLAFKTRRLPDNFNESRFISMCVSTKLVVLCCFVPAYIVSQRQLLRMLMLALAVALNHSVALVFLFLPKIYAVCYLEGAGDINQTTVHGGGAGGVTRSMNGSTTETGTGVPGLGGRPRVSMMNVGLPRIGESHVECEHAQHNGSGVFDSEDKAPNFNQIHPV
ncbi:metabotropic glutamate receptor 5-like [Littorina saxatilis]